MLTQRWSWLIAKTNASDEELLNWAYSYTAPPSIEAEGARLAFPSYSAERRAMRLIATGSRIRINLKPKFRTMNPVFEIDGAPGELRRVDVDSRKLAPDEYAWDGETLWIRAPIDQSGAAIALQFR